jgi:UDPglucose 6-dehydrogenase
MRVSIVGAGTVGAATGMGLHKHGHEVLFHDVDRQRLDILASQGYRVAGNLDSVRASDIHMICVPAPANRLDSSPLESAITGVAKALVEQDIFQVVVIRSTVLPFTTTTRIIPLLQRHCPLKLGQDYGVCYNPEFLREAHALQDFLSPPITVIGEADKRSGDLLAELSAPFGAPQLRTTPENAEAIKCFSNAFNALKISFFNELYLIAASCGLDHETISEALPVSATAIRIPGYGIEGGYPFGGKCLPKDLAAVISFAEGQGLNPVLFEAVASVNEQMKRLNANP